MNDYIRRVRWQKGRAKEHGLIATTDDGRVMVGFGCWKHQQRPRENAEPEPVVQIQYFGIGRQFRGAMLPGGAKCADVLYATLESDAFAHADSSPDMPVDLFCDTENARGITFWRRQGFEILEQVDGKRPNQYHRMRRYP